MYLMVKKEKKNDGMQKSMAYKFQVLLVSFGIAFRIILLLVFYCVLGLICYCFKGFLDFKTSYEM